MNSDQLSIFADSLMSQLEFAADDVDPTTGPINADHKPIKFFKHKKSTYELAMKKVRGSMGYLKRIVTNARNVLSMSINELAEKQKEVDRNTQEKEEIEEQEEKEEAERKSSKKRKHNEMKQTKIDDSKFYSKKQKPSPTTTITKEKTVVNPVPAPVPVVSSSTTSSTSLTTRFVVRVQEIACDATVADSVMALYGWTVQISSMKRAFLVKSDGQNEQGVPLFNQGAGYKSKTFNPAQKLNTNDGKYGRTNPTPLCFAYCDQPDVWYFYSIENKRWEAIILGLYGQGPRPCELPSKIGRIFLMDTESKSFSNRFKGNKYAFIETNVFSVVKTYGIFVAVQKDSNSPIIWFFENAPILTRGPSSSTINKQVIDLSLIEKQLKSRESIAHASRQQTQDLTTMVQQLASSSSSSSSTSSL